MDRRTALREALAALPGVVEAPSRWKPDLAFWVDAREVAHFEGDAAIDIRATRAQLRAHPEWLADPTLATRHGPSSDWVEVRFDTPDGYSLALAIARAAVAAHQPGSPRDRERSERSRGVDL